MASTGDGPDNTSALSTSFHTLSGIALDAAANILVADPIRPGLRLITPGGTISTSGKRPRRVPAATVADLLKPL